MPNSSKPSLYLSGSIEFSKTYKGWREKIYKELHKYYNVIIPEKSHCPFDKTDPEFKSYFKEKTVNRDMISVATSHYFFVKLDKAVFKGAGTISEITTAAWMGKHIMVLYDNVKLKSIASWTLGCLAGSEEVKSIDDAIIRYKEMALRRKTSK